MSRPGFWMDETSGVLRPAVEAYLLREDELSPAQIGALRAYFRQRVAAPQFRGPEVTRLREEIDAIASREAINRWLAGAIRAGIDPL